MKTATTTFLVHTDGVLEIKDFKARTFAKALEPLLPAKWDKKPCVLAKTLKASPDILTVIIGIMNSFAEFLWEERIKTEEKIEKRTAVLEKSCKDKAFDAKVIKKDAELKLLYKVLSIYDEKLWTIEEKSPKKWLQKINKKEFTAIVEGLKDFLKQEITDAWSAFNPAFDTAQGAAVELFRQESADTLDALDLRFLKADGISLPLAVATNLSYKDLVAAAKKANLPFAFTVVKEKPTKKAPPKSNTQKNTKKISHL